MSNNVINHFLSLVEEKMSLPKDSLLNILDDDDWSFIIKISSIVEKSLNYLIAEEIENASFKKIVFELGLEKKLNLALGMGLIDKEAFVNFNYIRNLRNDAAHGVVFSFENCFNKNEKLNAYKSQFQNVWSKTLTLNKKKVSNSVFAVQNPKLTLFISIASHISFANLDLETRKLKKKSNQLLKAFLKY